MADYRLAIIIPSWNCSMYIAEMLDSIIANTFTDWRCFVVDDQSEDDSCDVIKAYQDKDKRIVLKVRDKEPKGAQTCRNIGFELSNGAEYVIWFDADDIIAPYCLEQRVAYMDSHKDLDFCIFPAKKFCDNPLEPNDELWGYDFLGDTLRCFLNRTLMVVGWTNIYRRQSVVDKKLQWDVNVQSLQDADWNIQAIVSGLKFDYASKEGALIDYFYRYVPSGIASKIRTSRHCASHVYHVDKTLKSLTAEQLYKYELDIRACLLLFASVLRQYNSQAYDDLLNIEWFNTHKLDRLKLKILKITKGRGVYRLFGKEMTYRDNINREWLKYRRDKYAEYTAVHDMHTIFLARS